MKNSITIALAFMLVASVEVNAQTKIEKAVADKESLEKKAFWDFPKERGKNGKGYTVYYPALGGVPKKVALATIAIHDPGFTKTSKSGTVTTSQSVRIPDASLQIIINAYADKSVKPLQEAFKSHGMELLTPDQFLDTEEKKKAYRMFTYEKTKNAMGKAFNKIGSNGTHVTSNLAAEGYRAFIPVQENVRGLEGANTRNPMMYAKYKQTSEDLGKRLCDVLEVDAVVIVFYTMFLDKLKTPTLEYATLAMYGPNPVERESDGPLSRDGVYYGVSRVKINQPIGGKKGNPYMSTDGIENIGIALANKLGIWLEEKTAEEDKRK